VAAEIDLGVRPRDEVLRGHGLSEAAWASVEARWTAAIVKEVDVGRTALLEAFDTAYVARVEAARGPISPRDLARLIAGGSRKAPAVLPGAALPRTGLMRVKRAGVRRLAGDAKLAAAVQEALARGDVSPPRPDR